MIAKTLLSVCAALLAVGAAGCSKDNLVTASWAVEARGVPMNKVPLDDDPREVIAKFVQGGEPDEDDLEDLSYAEELSEVTVTLEAGQFELLEPTFLETKRFVLEGAGSDKTQLLLDCEALTTLLIKGAETVVVRNLTLIGLSGGGFKLRGCGAITLEDVHVVGARWGFDIEDGQTTVTNSVFAGCQEGIAQENGTLTISDSCFANNWQALRGRATVELEACAFIKNQAAVDMRLNSRSRVRSCLFAGERQDLAWSGKPGEARSNLANLRDVGSRLGRRTNLPINHFEEFPEGLKHGMPLDFQLARVHLAIQRWQLRGDSDPPRALKDFREDQARRYGIAAQQALATKELEKAKRAARQGLAYWGDRPLSGAPEELLDVAELAQ